MAWSSIRELRELAQRELGIDPDAWPFYPDVELEEDFPLDDVRARCEALRMKLATVPPGALPDDAWLRRFALYLSDGADFCAKAW